MYGFSAARGMKGIGVTVWCEDCDAFQYHADWEGCTEEEMEWYKSNPIHEGWMINESL